MSKSKRSKRQNKKQKKIQVQRIEDILHIGNSKTQAVPLEVDNPDYQPGNSGEKANPKRAGAYINMRESPCVWLFSHNKIDLAQYDASKEFRRNYEQAGRSDVVAIDFAKPIIDHSNTAVDKNLSRFDAAKWMGAIRGHLTAQEYETVEFVCGECLFINQSGLSEWKQKQKTAMLKSGLDKLVDVLNLTHNKNIFWKDMK